MSSWSSPHRLNRRSFLSTSVAGIGLLSQSCRSLPRARAIPLETAPANPLAQSFDAEMTQFMEARRIPGGALAVVKDRRLLYAQGYGWGDRENGIPATPRSLFRIASISKPITALAVLKLAEERLLDLDAPAFALLGLEAGHASVSGARSGPNPAADTRPDPRLNRITVRQLLQHTAGWDRDKSFDPMFRSRAIAEAMGAVAPATPPTIIRYMLGQPLDFDPGTRYAYSNFGYCVLGRIIERLTGQDYAAFVRRRILAPCGIQRMRIGASLSQHQAPGEVRYYMPDEKRTAGVFPNLNGKVAWPYGGFFLEAMDAHGGWIASAVDLARLAAALSDAETCPILEPDSFGSMAAPPPPPAWRRSDGTLEAAYYGCGWLVRPLSSDRNGRANYWHSGSLPGTATLLVRRGDGVSWAALFNQRSMGPRLPDSAIDPALHRAAAAVAKPWPEHDLFPEFT